MGQMVDGRWTDQRVAVPTDDRGRFQRPQVQFRQRVSTDGSSPFPAAAGRYHLYVSHACPWCHRTTMAHALKGLGTAVPIHAVDPLMLEGGWQFLEPEPVHGARFVHELYARASSSYTGRVTVPVLWDTATDTLVNNESSDIIEMFDHAFDAWGDADVQLYPRELRNEIDSVAAYIYTRINNGVYRAGFARTQEAYEEAVLDVFSGLDAMEHRLERRQWLVGDRLTLADLRLFATAIRFDAVYFTHFKCNLRRLADYPRLSAHAHRLYELPGVAETVRFDEIKTHYFASHRSLNRRGIVPIGPALDFTPPSRTS